LNRSRWSALRPFETRAEQGGELAWEGLGHIADMILNHAIKDAPKSRQHYDTHHYIAEKREAL
jgi:hypothetical protein